MMTQKGEIMLRVFLASALAVFVGGCSTLDPDTPPGASYAINCPSTYIHHCFSRANELCPRGYEVVSMRRNNDPIAQAIAPDRLVVRCQGQ